MNADLQSDLIFAYLSQWLIEMAKRAKWFPFVHADRGKLNKLLAAFLAAAYSAGMTFTLTHVGPGHWTLEAVGLTAANITHFLGHAVMVYAAQKGFFKLYTMPGKTTASALKP
jgi:hypothetical protein